MSPRSDFPAQAVLARIEWGHDRAVPIGDLAEALQWPRRAIEQAIQDLRLQGKPVASGPAGIWLGDSADIAATLHSLRGRMVSQYQTYLALRKTARRMEGTQQLPLAWKEEAA